MSSETTALFVLVAIAMIPLAMLSWVAIEQLWDRATHLAYLWRHRRFLRF